MQTPPPLPNPVQSSVEEPVGKGALWPWMVIFALIALPPCLVYVGVSLGMKEMAGIGLGLLPVCALGFGSVLPVALMKKGGGVAGAGCLGLVLYLIVETIIVFSGAKQLVEGI